MQIFEGKTIQAAIKQICLEKGLPEEAVIETLESALAAAYRKDFGEKNQNPKANLDIKTGDLKIFDEKIVVENLTKKEIEQIDNFREIRQTAKEEGRELTEAELPPEDMRRFNPRAEIELKDAKKIKKTAKVADVLEQPLEIPGDFGRMAAQTAKQVIIQRLREAERNVVYETYKDKEGKIIYGTIHRKEMNGNILVDLERRATAIMFPNDQIRNENYKLGSRFKFYVKEVNLTTRGPEIILSRTSPEIVRELFTFEIPEIESGAIEIKALAREAGRRTKVAIFTEDENLDPVGSCIGQKGTRIQTIINELNGEKVDIIVFSDDQVEYIKNALSPAKITNVDLDEKEKIATVTVPDDQLSLTIGRAGQNVRLASKLTEWTINIKVEGSEEEFKQDEIEEEKKEIPEEKEEKPTKKPTKKTPVKKEAKK